MNDETTTKRNPYLIFGGVLVLLVAFALLLLGPSFLTRGGKDDSELSSAPAIGDTQAAAPPGFAGVARVGDAAPDFKLQDLDGNEVSLADMQGKAVMVNFWATTCAPCRHEMPAMQEIFEEYADQGFEILAVNQDLNEEDVAPFFYEEFGLTFTPVLDPRKAVAHEYGVFALPFSFFIDADGIIQSVKIGAATKGELETATQQILPNG